MILAVLEGYKEVLEKSNADAETMKQALQHGQKFVEVLVLRCLGLSS